MNDPFDLEQLSIDKLEALRSICDPLADDVLKEVIKLNQEDNINKIFMTLVSNHSITDGSFSELGEEIAQVMNDYFKESAKLPEWADMTRIKNGESVFALYGPEIFMILNMSSLPLCYSCAKGAEVLYRTGRLMSHGGDIDPLSRRLMETAQMVTDVLSPGGLSESGSGTVTMQKVRLIHASIRYYLTQKNGWDQSEFGEPINQEDLAGTLMSFGPVIISGLKQLGVPLTNDQIEDYIHTWKVVGHMMGIRAELLPDNFDHAFSLANKILNHEAAKSEAGAALTSSCILFVQNMIPGDLFQEVPAFMTNFFLNEYSKASGKDLSECINLSDMVKKRDSHLLSFTKFIVGEISHLEDMEIVRKLAKPFNKALLAAIIKHYNFGKKVNFSIPSSLTKNWQQE